PALHRRVAAARRLRETLLPSDLGAYRVVNAEGDGVPGATVDRYGEYLVAHLFTPAMERWRDALYDALVAVWQPRAIYEQRRYRPQTGEGVREPAMLARGAAAPVELEVA